MREEGTGDWGLEIGDWGLGTRGRGLETRFSRPGPDQSPVACSLRLGQPISPSDFRPA